MTISISKFEKILFLITLVLAGAIFVLNVTKNDDKITNIFYLSFVLVLILYIISCRRSFYYVDVLCIIIIAAAFFSVMINFLFNSTPFSFEYFKKYFIFATAVIFLTYCAKSKNIKLNISVIALLFTGISAFCAVYFILFRNSLYYNNAQHLLSFNLVNPNFAALFLSVFSMSQFSFVIRKKEPVFLRVINFILGVFLLYLVLQTQSRSAVLTLLFFVVLGLLFILFHKTKQLSVSKWVAVIVAVFPLVFALCYLLLIHNSFINTLFNFLSGEGKGLDARETIWEFALSHVKRSPLIGAYNEISGGKGFSQMHNTHIDVMASYGIPVLILLCCFLFHVIYNRGQYYSSEQVIYLIAFIFSVVLGIGEAALFSGGQGLYIFVGCFLMLSRQNNDSNIKIGVLQL